MDASFPNEPQSSSPGLCESVSRTADDAGFYQSRFGEESVRLFGDNVDELESLVISCNESDPASSQTMRGVDEVLRENREDAKLYFHVIRQEYSWGRFLLSRTSLEALLSYHKVFPRFYDVINAFGFKTTEDDKVWEGFHSRRTFMPQDVFKHDQFELCYCIRYVHKHGRDPKKPWSLRQLGVYQQSQGSDQPPTWILVQPPERLEQRLRNILLATVKDRGNMQTINAVLHLVVLSTALSNWDEYIDYSRKELTELDDKACFSRVGIDNPNDYPVAFADKQKLQRLRKKLLRTLSVLDSNISVIRSLKSQYQRGHGGPATEEWDLILEELDSHLAHCDRHRRNFATLMEETHGIDDLLSKILSFRNDRVHLRNSQAMQDTLDALNEISAQSAEVAQQSKRDSRVLKWLTLIATMYLPASLLATLFSSNLIQVVQNGTPSDKATHLKLVTQFWVYILLAVVLTGASLLPAILLQRKSRAR
ncbi:uncharacterized protein PV07_11854 [Cladophialophora immunda]|uniref:CorA-like transporter domain-containing protein n=1 Tax=Cladophialophora immunda TaxID=569365 RepID=A0A0D2CJD7_9EURO|nr:uncharacterized protein PV07_11854 [Cladophialophora immunda]KIW23674.1 hypothetical protein PV07_11854 [Cladophialophora immunda]